MVGREWSDRPGVLGLLREKAGGIMSGKRRLLIVDDDPGFQKTAGMILQRAFSCQHAERGEVALERDLSDIDAVLLDIELGHGIDGFQVLEKLVRTHPDLPVIMISRREDVDSVVKALRLGAIDYIGKTFKRSELALKIEQALARRRLAEENRVLREDARARLGRLVGDSPAMQAVRDEILRVAEVPSVVLITGESGTGKEVVARDIHELGPRARHPFIPVNCSAIPEALFESALFGHERGAFTGADRRVIGRFEAAGSGTVFLDEIGEMPPATQAKLLRVLQDRRFERVGSVSPISLEARLIAATNHEIERLVQEGEFREDLFYRLNVLRIQIPPLRERLDDVALLVPHLVEKKANELNRRVSRISKQAIESLQGWHWPGNVRELENAIERALVRMKGDVLEPDDFPELEQVQLLACDFATARQRAVEAFERQYVRAVLEACDGNISEAARRMQLSRYGLQKILARLDIEKRETRDEGD